MSWSPDSIFMLVKNYAGVRFMPHTTAIGVGGQRCGVGLNRESQLRVDGLRGIQQRLKLIDRSAQLFKSSEMLCNLGYVSTI